MIPHTHCAICGRFVPWGATYCAECAIVLDYPEANPRERDEDDGQTYSDPRDERNERRGD